MCSSDFDVLTSGFSEFNRVHIWLLDALQANVNLQ